MSSSPSTPAQRAKQRPSKMAPPAPQPPNGAAEIAPSNSKPAKRASPYLPTPLESALLLLYPSLLLFGALFSLLSPQTRAAPWADSYGQGFIHHAQDPALAPSYFARKDNAFNTLFVKRGWGWVTVAFVVFVATHPAIGTARARVRATVRWALVTGWWALVTQWCFGPPIIDRGFRFTGGKCEIVREKIEEEGGVTGVGEAFSAAACRAVGGRWSGGHDISGHVFLLVLGSYFLLQEVGWVVLRWRGRSREERSVVMGDRAVKGAGVEAEGMADGAGRLGTLLEALGVGGKAVAAVVVLSWWMLLMTAIYFHTWFEKVSTFLWTMLHVGGSLPLTRTTAYWPSRGFGRTVRSIHTAEVDSRGARSCWITRHIRAGVHT